MRIKQVNKEVLFTTEKIAKVKDSDIELLKKKANANQRKRIRLCAHNNIKDKLHEMLIVHTKDTYVRPHKHLKKSESFHIINGIGDVILFNDSGEVIEVIPMGDYSSGRIFYYRISEPYYHTLLIRSAFPFF